MSSTTDLQNLTDDQVYHWCLEYWRPTTENLELLARLSEDQITQVHLAYFERFRYRRDDKTEG